MGVVMNVSATEYPKQTDNKGKRVCVHFNYNLKQDFYGVIIRDDAVPPFRTIFWLDDGRIILATECQYQPLP